MKSVVFLKKSLKRKPKILNELVAIFVIVAAGVIVNVLVFVVIKVYNKYIKN